jgi:hypothetical protein
MILSASSKLFMMMAICLFLQGPAVAEEYKLQFLGEDRNPIPEAMFYLYEVDDDGQVLNAVFRDHKLPQDATISLKSLPVQFEMGIVNTKLHYYQSWSGSDLKLKPGANVIQVPMSGTVELVFSKSIPNDFHLAENPMVVACFRKSTSGEQKFTGGVGVFLAMGKTISIHGLVDGDYLFMLKKTYDSPNVFWMAQDVKVISGKTLKLKDLTAQKPFPK